MNSSGHFLLYTHTHTHKALSIKPLVSLHADALVTTRHQFLLVLLHQAFKTVPISVHERLLCCFNILKKKTKHAGSA